MNDARYRRKLRKARELSNDRLMRKEISDIKHRYKSNKRIETSKLLAVYLFLLLNSIVVYAMISMWHFTDLSYLGVLISDIAAQVIVYAIYCLKAYHGKKQEERNKLIQEQMHESNDAQLESAEDVGDPDSIFEDFNIS